MSSLNNQVVLVVGGGSGIGLATGVTFAKEGSRVVLAARTASALEAAKKMPQVGASFVTKVCDASDRKQANELIKAVTAEVGPIEILVYCAGINVKQRTFADIDPAEFDRVQAINSTGAFNCMHAVLPSMRKRKSGTIINVVSISGTRLYAVSGLPYVASKYAQAAIGLYANHETNADGVRVTNLYPGETATPILDKRPVPPSPEQRAKMLQPEDVAEMALAVAKLPARAVVPEVVITPRHMPLV